MSPTDSRVLCCVDQNSRDTVTRIHRSSIRECFEAFVQLLHKCQDRMKDFGLVPHRPARWPPGVMFCPHFARKYRPLGRFCRLVSTVPSIIWVRTASMAWKRSSVRSRSGPPINQQLASSLLSRLVSFGVKFPNTFTDTAPRLSTFPPKVTASGNGFTVFR